VSAARDNLRRERELLARLTVELRAELLTVCRYVTRDDDLAQDAVQNALVELWRHSEALSDGNGALVRTIARTQALMVMRTARRHDGAGNGPRMVRLDDLAEFEGPDDDPDRD
jgi:DNA-directed RNA polymerase specialized sigma24 family protein